MTGARFQQLTIRTPEGVAFSMTLASLVSRTLAWSIDAVIIAACVLVIGKISTAIGALSPDSAGAFQMIGGFVVAFGYGILLEWKWRGQTLGKRLFKITVVDARGLPLTFSQVAIRNLLRWVDKLLVLYLVGGVVAILSRRNQRLGDLAAGTVVIRQLETSEPAMDAITSGKYNSFRQYPQLENRLRHALSPDELSICVQALLRRQQLESPSRIGLFDTLATALAERVTFPEEATARLSSEQYVRNAVDSIYRQQKSSDSQKNADAAKV